MQNLSDASHILWLAAFDDMGRLKQTTSTYPFISGSPQYSVQYGYDKASNRTSMADPQSGVTSYVYDTLNRLTSLTNPQNQQFTFGYDNIGRRTSLNRPNTVNTTYAYDTLSRLASVTHKKGATTLDGDSYTYDAAGNRLSNTRLTNVKDDYTYDAIYQLILAKQGATTKEQYTYDLVGNRLSTLANSGWTYNSSNEMTSRVTSTFTYDNNGNTRTKVAGSSTTTYNWDLFNQMSSVVLPASGGTVSFKYDPFGRRIYKNLGSATTVYVYDGDNVLEELDSTGSTVAAKYTQGPGIDEPLAILRSGVTSYYQQDGIGSVTSLTDSAGTKVSTYTYDAFGNPYTTSGTVINNFRYTGRELDSETNLYYYRARYYERGAGRFLNEDPIRFRGSINFYRYVDNDPTAFRDPTGRGALGAGLGALIGGIGGAVIGGIVGTGAGAVGGTLALPGGGTIAGGIAGGAEGIAVGGATGAAVGAVVGNALEDLIRKFPRCQRRETFCNYVGEFKDPTVDAKFKICYYSCSDGIGRSIIWPIMQPCPLFQRGAWGLPW